jgi:hypothetical protein
VKAMLKAMLKEALEKRVGQVSNSEFAEIMEAATEDIKFNYISFKKKISLQAVLDIAERCAITLKRCA